MVEGSGKQRRQPRGRNGAVALPETPAMHFLRACRNLIASSARPEGLSERQAAYVAHLQDDVAGRPVPPAQTHLVSVLLAFAKAGLLAAFVWQGLLALA